MRNLRARRCRQSSRTMESTPPESPTATRSEGLTTFASCAATRATNPPALPPPFVKGGPGGNLPPPFIKGGLRGDLFLLDFLELAIADELLEARLEQPVHRGFPELPPALLQCLLEILHCRVVIAVRAA